MNIKMLNSKATTSIDKNLKEEEGFLIRFPPRDSRSWRLAISKRPRWVIPKKIVLIKKVITN
jgi:hypothetical protein